MFRRNNCGRINHASFYCMNIKGTNKTKRESVKSKLYSGNTSKNIHMEEKCTRKLYWFCQSYHFFWCNISVIWHDDLLNIMLTYTSPLEMNLILNFLINNSIYKVKITLRNIIIIELLLVSYSSITYQA